MHDLQEMNAAHSMKREGHLGETLCNMLPS